MQVVGAANAECRMQNAECRRSRSRAIHHTSFILHPSARRGISLLEVLVSIFILSVGLLGVAALIPIGKLSLVETNISDRTGACGRAALREIKIRRLLDPACRASTPGGSFVIDPLGELNIGATLGPLTRINLYTAPGSGTLYTTTTAPSVFIWPDDLIVTLPKDMTTPQNGDRSSLQISGGVPQNEGAFSWFFTVTPQRVGGNMTGVFDVSAVVCHKRDFTANGEYSTDVTQFLGAGYGGGTLELANGNLDDLRKHLKIDQWIMLVGTNGTTTVAKWYRIVGLGLNEDTTNPMRMITVVGPDWDTTLTTTLVAVDGVTGVYTSTITLDTDSLWNQ